MTEVAASRSQAAENHAPPSEVALALRGRKLTDAGNAERLAERHGADLRYVPESGWHSYDGRRWKRDDDGEVMRRAKDTVLAILQEAAEASEDDRKRLVQHATRSEAEPRLRAMVALAEIEARLIVRLAALNADPWLLNVANGTVDLTTGALRKHRREDLLTQLVPVQYEPDAQAPRFESFLNQVLAGRSELIAFVQRLVGYTLSGSIAEQVMAFLYGRGRNGKSTFLETLRAMLGDYAQQAPAEMLFAQRPGTIRNDLARLPGVRFVVTVETGEARRLDEPLVKQLTGGDTIVARRLYRDYFEFRPTHKLWLATNHLPQITGTDEAIWRRLALIPFDVTIPEDECDPDLPAALQRELPGILAWAVEGALAYRRDGLGQPDAVREATAAYRSDMDAIGSFIDECCVLADGARAKASELYTRYTYWASAAGERETLTQKAFSTRLQERGFERVKRNDGAWYLGIGLLAGDANP